MPDMRRFFERTPARSVLLLCYYGVVVMTETHNLVVGVSSPGSVGYDREKKQSAYARAGVPEYWIADPWSCTVEVLTLEAGAYRSLGVFERKAVLSSHIVPDFLVRVGQFFA